MTTSGTRFVSLGGNAGCINVPEVDGVEVIARAELEGVGVGVVERLVGAGVGGIVDEG
jgi:hypothetical protein